MPEDSFTIRGSLNLKANIEQINANRLSEDIRKKTTNLKINNIDVTRNAQRKLRGQVRDAISGPFQITSDNIQVSVRKWKAVNVKELKNDLDSYFKTNPIAIAAGGAAGTPAAQQTNIFAEEGGERQAETAKAVNNELINQIRNQQQIVRLFKEIEDLGARNIGERDTVGIEQNERQIRQVVDDLKELGVEANLSEKELQQLARGGLKAAREKKQTADRDLKAAKRALELREKEAERSGVINQESLDAARARVEKRQEEANLANALYRKEAAFLERRKVDEEATLRSLQKRVAGPQRVGGRGTTLGESAERSDAIRLPGVGKDQVADLERIKKIYSEINAFLAGRARLEDVLDNFSDEEVEDKARVKKFLEDQVRLAKELEALRRKGTKQEGTEVSDVELPQVLGKNLDPNILKRFSATIEKEGLSGLQKVSDEMKRFGEVTQDALGKKAADRIKANSIFKFFGIQARRLVVWTAVAGTAYEIRNALRDLVRTSIEFEKSMINVTKVMQVTETQMQQMRDAARLFGTEFGFSLKEVTDAMVVYAQQGRTIAEVTQLTEASMLLANVSALNLTQATEALTASLEQFGFVAKDSIGIIDSWNEVANKHAVTEVDLFEALKRSGSAAAEAGVKFEEFAGFVAALQARTRRGGKIIGTTLKTLFSRLNTDTAIKQLNEVGVATFNLSGEFRTATERLTDISNQWDQLNSVQRNNIAFAIAGRRQYSQFLALMQGFAQAQQASRDASDAQGSAFEEQRKILDTLDKRIARLTARWQSFGTTLSEGGLTDALKVAVGFADSLLAIFTKLSPLFSNLAIATGVGAAGIGLSRTVGSEIAKSRGKGELAESIKNTKILELLNTQLDKAVKAVKAFVSSLILRRTTTTTLPSGAEINVFRPGGRTVGEVASRAAGSTIGGVAIGALVSAISNGVKEALATGPGGRQRTEEELRFDTGFQAARGAEFAGAAVAFSSVTGATKAIAAFAGTTAIAVSGAVAGVTLIAFGIAKVIEYWTDWDYEVRRSAEELTQIRDKIKSIEGDLNKLRDLELKPFSEERIEKQIDAFREIAATYPELNKFANEYFETIATGASGADALLKITKELREEEKRREVSLGRAQTRSIRQESRADRATDTISSIQTLGGLNQVGQILDIGTAFDFFTETDLRQAARQLQNYNQSLAGQENIFRSIAGVFGAFRLSPKEIEENEAIIKEAVNRQLDAFTPEIREVTSQDIRSREDLTRVRQEMEALMATQLAAAADEIEKAEGPLKDVQTRFYNRLLQEFQNGFALINSKLVFEVTGDVIKNADQLDRALAGVSTRFDIIAKSTDGLVKQIDRLGNALGFEAREQRLAVLENAATRLQATIDQVDERGLTTTGTARLLRAGADQRGGINRALRTEGGFGTPLAGAIAREFFQVFRRTGGAGEPTAVQAASTQRGRLFGATIGQVLGPDQLQKLIAGIQATQRGEGPGTAADQVQKSIDILKEAIPEIGDQLGIEDLQALLSAGTLLQDPKRQKEEIDKIVKATENYNKQLDSLQENYANQLNTLGKEFSSLADSYTSVISASSELRSANQQVANSELELIDLRFSAGGNKELKAQEKLVKFRELRERQEVQIESNLVNNARERANLESRLIELRRSAGADESEAIQQKAELIKRSGDEEIGLINERSALINREFSLVRDQLSAVQAESQERTAGRRALFTADPFDIQRQQIAFDQARQLFGSGTRTEEGRTTFDSRQLRESATLLSRDQRDVLLKSLETASKTASTEEVRSWARGVLNDLFQVGDIESKRKSLIDQQRELIKERKQNEEEIKTIRKDQLTAQEAANKIMRQSEKDNIDKFKEAIKSFKEASDEMINRLKEDLGTTTQAGREERKGELKVQTQEAVSIFANEGERADFAMLLGKVLNSGITENGNTLSAQQAKTALNFGSGPLERLSYEDLTQVRNQNEAIIDLIEKTVDLLQNPEKREVQVDRSLTVNSVGLDEDMRSFIHGITKNKQLNRQEAEELYNKVIKRKEDKELVD